MHDNNQFAVIGDPVAHSLSPQIHQHFANQCGINLSYTFIETPIEEFDDNVNEFFANAGSGLNVTMPLKHCAHNYADLLSDRALNAGAVNTLKFLDGDLVYGDNTDGAGLIFDLENNLNISLKDARVLIIGAGGAVGGCLHAIMQCKPQQVFISNRTQQKALDLIDRLDSSAGIDLLPNGYNDNFDLIINGTSTSVTGQKPNLDTRLLSGAVCYDMVYGDNAVPFTKWCLAQGAKAAHDGIGMLVEQAAESFMLWHEVRPDTAGILKLLKSQSTKRR